MAPTTCFLTILEYIRTFDYSEARTYAAILQTWLSNRGFYPEDYPPEYVDSVLAELLKPACAPNGIRTRFESLTCYECDAGQDIASLKQAIDDGWIELVGDKDLTVTSHLGTCPTCRMRQVGDLLPE